MLKERKLDRSRILFLNSRYFYEFLSSFISTAADPSILRSCSDKWLLVARISELVSYSSKATFDSRFQNEKHILGVVS